MQELEPQIFGAIIGASATAIVSVLVVFFTNRGHNKRLEKQHAHDLRLSAQNHFKSKIEELFYAFSRWETIFGGMYVRMIGFVKGEMSEQDTYASAKKDRLDPGHKERVDMLLALYFPDLIAPYQKVMEARGKIVEFFPPNSKHIGNLSGYYEAQENFESLSSEFKSALKLKIDEQ